MSHIKSLVTPLESSALGRALAAVADAFKTRDEVYTWKMLKMAYRMTAKKEIIEECRKYKNEVEQQLDIYNRKMEGCQQEHLKYPIVLQRDSYLEKVNEDFHEKIMMLISEVGWTEFDHYGPIREESFAELEGAEVENPMG